MEASQHSTFVIATNHLQATPRTGAHTFRKQTKSLNSPERQPRQIPTRNKTRRTCNTQLLQSSKLSSQRHPGRRGGSIKSAPPNEESYASEGMLLCFSHVVAESLQRRVKAQTSPLPQQISRLVISVHLRYTFMTRGSTS